MQIFLRYIFIFIVVLSSYLHWYEYHFFVVKFDDSLIYPILFLFLFFSLHDPYVKKWVEREGVQFLYEIREFLYSWGRDYRQETYITPPVHHFDNRGSGSSSVHVERDTNVCIYEIFTSVPWYICIWQLIAPFLF